MKRASTSRRWMAAAILTFTLTAGLAVGCGGDGSNPAGVGNACETDDDCETDNCYQGPGGGYCTAECSNEGAVENCPDDTICKPIQGGPARCLLICGSESACDGSGDCPDAECPDGSSCVDISDSDQRACEPDPE